MKSAGTHRSYDDVYGRMCDFSTPGILHAREVHWEVAVSCFLQGKLLNSVTLRQSGATMPTHNAPLSYCARLRIISRSRRLGAQAPKVVVHLTPAQSARNDTQEPAAPPGVILDKFRAQRAIPAGVGDGLNAKAKPATKNSGWLRIGSRH
jgi:hypothetical protein